MKVNKIILIFTVISSFLMCSTVFIDNSLASNITYRENFDTYYSGQQISKIHGSFFDSSSNLHTTNFNVSLIQKYSGTSSFIVSGKNTLKGYFNISSTGEYFNNFSFLVKFSELNGESVYLHFNNTNNKNFLKLRLNGVTSSPQFLFDYWDGASYVNIYTYTGSSSNWLQLNITRVTDTSLNVTCSIASTQVRLKSLIIGTLSYLTNFSYILFQGFSAAPQPIYFDNIIFTSGITLPPSSLGHHIKFKYYDGQTGDEIKMYNYANGLYKPIDSIAVNHGMCSIGSTLFPVYYFNDGNNNKQLDTIAVNFTEGLYYPINITSATYYTYGFFYDGDIVTHLQSFSGYFKLYDNITISIVLYPLGYEFFENEKIELHDDLIWGLRTDKKLYTYPEQVLIQYMFPKAVDMVRKGKPLDSNWKIYASDVSNWYRDSAENKSFGGFIYDAEWHSLKPFTPPDTVDGIDTYSMVMFRDTWIPGIFDDYVSGPEFTVLQATTFVPSGNITSILPYPVNIGEDITVTFNANNNGEIRVKHIPTNDILSIKTFDKPVTTATAKFNFARVGLFEVQLYVSYGVNKSLEDTETFYINVTGDNYEEWGYNVPYLMVEGDKIITEFDTLIVYYKSLQNNTEIRINSPRGSRAPFSTMVSNKTGGILKIPFKSWMTIGRWNISMNISTYPYVLTDYFNVIADENNFMDFTKNEYDIEESIAFYLRHNVRCKVTFLKGDIQRGTDIFFENGTLPDGYYTLIDTSFFDYGTWTIQLWQTNNRIPIRLLVEDYIIINPHKTTLPNAGNIGGFSLSIQPPFSYFAGAFIIILLTLTPIFFGYMFKIDLGSIPQFLYLVFALIGFVISILFGFFPIWSIALLIVVGALIVTILWLQRKIA
jgi:hypothetical protein